MYKQFLYCLVLATSMNHLSAATHPAYDRVEQEEDERETLTKVFDVVCEAAPYFMSLGALWFCYSMHQTHKEHAKSLNDHAKKLTDLENNHKTSAAQAKIDLDATKEDAKKARSADLEEIRKLKDGNAAVIAELKAVQERQAKESAAHSPQNPKSAHAAPGGNSRRGSDASAGSSFETVDATNDDDGAGSGAEGAGEANIKKAADKENATQK